MKCVHIPRSVLSVETMAFYGCRSLTEVVGGDGLVYLGDLSFARCGFMELRIWESVSSVGEMAFSSCEALTEVTVPSAVEEIMGNAFFGCSGLSRIEFEGTSTDLYPEALCVGTDYDPAEIEVVAPKGFVLPDDAYDGSTSIDLTILGERPYPYENFIGIAICLVVLFSIIRMFRRV